MATESGSKPIVITLQEALQRARAYSQQFQKGRDKRRLCSGEPFAGESRTTAHCQCRQPVHLHRKQQHSLRSVHRKRCVHVYNEQAVVHENLFSLVRRGEYLRTQAAEAVASAQKEIAARGLVFTVTLDYYNLIAAHRKIANANQALGEAQSFVDVTEKQEQAGNVSHVDFVKAQLQYEQLSRDLENATLASEQAHLTLSVLLFPDIGQRLPAMDVEVVPYQVRFRFRVCLR